jgi:hypothetical protein
MRKLLFGCVVFGFASSAAADPVHMIADMRCSAVQAAVQAEGSVILRWRSKSGMPLYGRYVSDRRFCHPGEIVSFASVPAGGRMCSVKKCVFKFRSRR